MANKDLKNTLKDQKFLVKCNRICKDNGDVYTIYYADFYAKKYDT